MFLPRIVRLRTNTLTRYATKQTWVVINNYDLHLRGHRFEAYSGQELWFPLVPRAIYQENSLIKPRRLSSALLKLSLNNQPANDSTCSLRPSSVLKLITNQVKPITHPKFDDSYVLSRRL